MWRDFKDSNYYEGGSQEHVSIVINVFFNDFAFIIQLKFTKEHKFFGHLW